MAEAPTKNFASVQLCASRNSCRQHSGSVLISYCIARIDATRSSTDLPSTASGSRRSTEATVDCSRQTRTLPQVLHLQPTAVDQDCSSRAFQAPLQTPSLVDATPLPGKSSPPSLLFCSPVRAYNCIPVSPACFQQQHPTQPLASLTLQSHLKTIF